MRYFRFHGGKWYPDNLAGHIKYGYHNFIKSYFVKSLSLIGKMMERMRNHE